MKLTKLLMSLLLGATLVLPATVGAYDQIYDSGCTANSTTWISAARTGGLSHYFRPTHNHLTKLQVIDYVSTPGKYNLYIKKDASTLYTKELAIPSAGQHYVMLEDFDIAVTPGELYRVHMVNITGNNGWYYKSSSTTCDPVGFAVWDGSIQNADMWVYLWGYDVAAPATPAETPDTPTPSTSTSTSGSTTTSTSTTPATVDETISQPILVRYEKNEETYNPPFDGEVSLEKDDTLNLVGTSFAGAMVTLFVGDNSYEADVLESGDWVADIPVDELDEGSYTITAQAKKGEQGSEIVELLKIKVLAATAEKVTPTETEKDLLSYIAEPWFIAGSLVLVLALIALLVFLEKKYHGIGKLFRKKAKAVEETVTEATEE